MTAELWEAIAARAIIDQAVGALMQVDRCTPEQGLQALARMSREARVTREQAARIVLRTLDGTAGRIDPARREPKGG